MYTEENNGYFMEGVNGVAGSMPDGSDDNRWVKAMGKYHKWESDIALCPSATKPWFYEDGTASGLRGTFLGSTSAWGYYQRDGWLKPFKGSYGINGWVNNPDPGKHHSGKPEKDHWRTPNVKGAAYVPMFFGAQRYNVWPEEKDDPPDYDGQVWSGNTHMARVCLNRHEGFINNIFLDFSGRKIGLKELWTLKWHQTYNVNGFWTRGGGITTANWPAWLRPLKDY